MSAKHVVWGLCLVLLLGCAPAFAQSAKPKSHVDLGAFTKEVMQLKIDGDQSQMAVWAPTEFFVQADMSDGSDTLESAQHTFAFLQPYIIMIVQCSLQKDDGTDVYATEHDVRSRAALVLADGSQVLPLQTVPPTVAAVATVLKSAISQGGGEDDKSLYVLIFPATTKNGKPIVDTSKKDKLALELKSTDSYHLVDFVWRTPFDTTHPIANCPYCGGQLSAKWSFCPWCGKPIEQK
ncbi:MAG TPA: zinc ribbon domain-containing protein [Capsulimonadaceae bacterium]|nr:zinc ribbon domain-containing protein [Capsulimonadaceae bacterium]